MTTHSPECCCLASYNVHGWVGTDGRTDTQRTMDVIHNLRADIIALQEVVFTDQSDRPCPFTELAQGMGYTVTLGPTMLRDDTRYGNALLSRREPKTVRRHSLDCFGREPRGAIEADFSFEDRTVKVIATHLGLLRKERRCQIRILHDIVADSRADATVLMGDLNEWLPWGHLPALLREVFGPTGTLRTFPSKCPIFALDRIVATPAGQIQSTEAVRTDGVRVASDHLPLRALLTLK